MPPALCAGNQELMHLTVHVPDDMIERVKDKLPPPELGVLEAVALDAILAFLNETGECRATERRSVVAVFLVSSGMSMPYKERCSGALA
jgi:hypothetical protein